jgi:hypothetical protein
MEMRHEKIEKKEEITIELILEVLQFYFSRLERISINQSKPKSSGMISGSESEQ